MFAVTVPVLADTLMQIARQGIVKAPAIAADPDVKLGATYQLAVEGE